MITFLDGPAARHHLALRNAPHFLRVVISPPARLGDPPGVDALDQADDVAAAGEELHAYVFNADGPRGSVYLCGRGKGVASGRFAIGEYRHLPARHAPPDEVMRSRDAWIAWVKQHGNDAAIDAGLHPWVPPPAT